MKFLMVAVAIISSHCAWGAIKFDLPGPFVDLPPSCTQDIGVHKPNSLGSSLNSPEGAGGALGRSIDSPPKGAPEPDRFEASTDLAFIPSPQHSGGNLTPQVAGVSPAPEEAVSPPTEPTRAVDVRKVPPPLNADLYMEHLPRPIFSKTTYDLIVCGNICIAGLIKSVKSVGISTPFLDYIQRITPDLLEKVAVLYYALTDSMGDVVEDFIADCRIANPTLRLTYERAELILEAVRMDLFHIRLNFLKDSKPG